MTARDDALHRSDQMAGDHYRVDGEVGMRAVTAVAFDAVVAGIESAGLTAQID